MGKRIGKSILKDKAPKQRLPSKKELEEWEEYQRELAKERMAEKKEEKMEEGLEEKLPRQSIPGEKVEAKEKRLLGSQILEPLEKEVEVTEVPDKRLKVGKKTRIDVKEVKE